MAKKAEAAVGPDADPVSRFEDAMKELEGIVQDLERGELKLEESLQLFRRGIELARQCRGALDGAELTVRNLLEADAPGDEAP
ncbi:exodeoxyribonuclease VII small subunit [Sinimarinibacterium flocculans]|uniref:Exodeoxyribonuclease 7 small subunit n=1 Tax=Sinimarinibacterium flocculans TaxID=985250 RepID=A0A318ENJ2_9GAMM|nr:exodeoxyribonuclease VII small subunit [Sinimarinibacterium flocculans]MEC9363433.1 exodeoxyribonuclease VII small subunit [Pseudomonadota bacterium]PXV71076.1 exodeoxyribonuclease VII small subunit [Sinimarinibacterium flocculans]